jgi:type IV secretory pathway component VirB8
MYKNLGILFFVTGLAMIVICIVLQRKNVVKFIVGLNQDLFLSLRSDRHSKVFVASRVNSPTPFRFPSRLQ